MASVRPYLRATLIVAAFIAFAAPPLDHPAAAQQDGANADREERGGRNGRRGGGPRGDRNGGRGGNRDRDNDRPAEPRPSAPPPVATSTANSFGTVSDVERIRQSATETIKSNDQDGNGILEGDELSKLGMSRDADKDSDGKITHNELVEFRMPKSTSAATGKPVTPPASAKSASDEPASSDLAERKIVNTSRKSYRFKTTKERISTWRHASKDANGDGQVSMNEYSRSWTERTANEFKRLDKDNDGMITVEEAK